MIQMDDAAYAAIERYSGRKRYENKRSKIK